MADERQLYFPFDAVEDEYGVYDRVFDAQDFADYFKQFISNGVYPNPSSGLAVRTPYETMTVQVSPGSGFIDGHTYILYENMNITVMPAHQVYRRIDAIMLRLDYINRAMAIVYKEGEPASSPAAPELIRNSDVYELKLCEISVGINANAIYERDILDTRLDTSVCGIVVAAVDTVDTEDIFRQYEDYLKELIGWIEAKKLETSEKIEGDYNDLKDDMENLRDFYNELRTDITKLQTFNFDNLFELPSTITTVNFNSDGTIHEIITKKINEDVVAERTTTYEEDGSIVVLTTLYDEDGISVMKKTEVTTIFEEDGNIRMVAR